ncbi:MAG: IscA/HesB family protein [Desulfovibrionales bacterium]|nr:IscA/HesB family protein [Desulfovibrionales bacterium]
MLTVTDDARKALDGHFDGKDIATIRIYLAPGGCSGPLLALALDDANEDDATLTAEPYTFCINKELLDKTGALTVDMLCEGFVIKSEQSLGGGGCASCGCSCG